MSENEIQQMFIQPSPKIGYGLYAIRKSLLRAVSDLKSKIFGEVLDLGCGIMPYKNFLIENGKIEKYVGVDIQYSNYHNQITPDFYWDGLTIPAANDSKDWIIVTEFLEHYYNTAHILKEIKRVLKPNGKVFFTFPCIYMLHEVPYDYHRFTPFSVNALFKDAGFKTIDIYTLGGFNYSLVIMMSLWNKNSGVRGLSRLFSKLFLFLFHKKLLNNDAMVGDAITGVESYKNKQMPSGLWGYAQK